MVIGNYRRTLELLLVFCFFFLSNILVFAYAFWLVPVLVLLVSVVWLILVLIVLWIMRKTNLISEFINTLKRNWIILPFLIFSGISILWSVVWEISFYRWLVLFCTVIAGGYIGLRYDIKKIMRLLSVFGVYILLIATILVFLFPHIGIMNYHSIQGAWSGAYWHKNHMGLVTTFMNLLFLIDLISSWQSGDRTKWLWGALYLYSLFFTYQTDSVAAYLVTILLHGLVLIGILWLKFRDRIRLSHYLASGAALLLVAVILLLNLDRFFGMFNRNTSLTGRIPMWTYLFNEYINKRPWLGYGFNAFWYVKDHQVATQLAAGYPDPIIIADNGFIDILVNTGYLGLILFLIFYFGMWVVSLKYASKAKDLVGLFPVILMTFTLLANISWSLIFENEGFFLLIMICIQFFISRSTSPNGFRIPEHKAT